MGLWKPSTGGFREEQYQQLDFRPFFDTLAKTVAAYSPSHKNQPETKLKSFGLVALAKENPNQLSIKREEKLI